MNKKSKVTKIEKKYKGKDGEQKSMTIEYAKVADRVKEFRQDCPNGKIEPDLKITEGYIFAKAFVKKDLSDPDSAEAHGTSVAKISNAPKEFEKLETLAVGRALAFLGYGASGEIASSEEMEEFLADQKQRKEQALEDAEIELKQSESLDDLKKVFLGLGSGLMANPGIIQIKDDMKAKFLTPSTK